MSRPTVSCIVPAYNYAHYLPAALDSALAQDYPHGALEIVVVDDGSTDHTPDVIAAYGDSIRSIRRPNGGLNAATQTGIEAATGELLTFLDADDTWAPDRTRHLVDALEAHPEAGLAWGDMRIVDAAGVAQEGSFRSRHGIAPFSGRAFGRLLMGNFVSAGSLMTRASLRPLLCPIHPEAPYQDYWIASQVSRVAPVVAIDAMVNEYRQHDGNMNLGADLHGKARLLASEVPFRRHLLQTARGLATSSELLAGLRQLDGAVHVVAAALGSTPDDLLALGTADREAAVLALHDASDALDAGDLPGALAELVRAAAHDPLFDQPRGLIAELAPHVAAQVASALSAA